MYFINKQNIIRFEIGEQAGKITGFIKHRTRGNSYFYSQLIRNNICKRCFSKTGRTVQQYMVE